jgi:hypothetical protein
VLALVPRPQLGQIVPEIGDRRFARIVQPFLHNVGEHTIGKMTIIAPRAGVTSDRLMVRVSGIGITGMPDWPMPANIKSFVKIEVKFVLPIFSYKIRCSANLNQLEMFLIK